jgi:hypothetical protein
VPIVLEAFCSLNCRSRPLAKVLGCTAECSAAGSSALWRPWPICRLPRPCRTSPGLSTPFLFCLLWLFRNRLSKTLRERRNQEVGISDQTLCPMQECRLHTEPRHALNSLTRRVPRPEKKTSCQTELRWTKVVDENNRQALILSLEWSATQIIPLKALAA